MAKGSQIKSIHAREVISERVHPGVETTVVTENGAVGVAMATAGVSVGIHEVQFAYDGGKRYNGRGVQKAAKIINDIIAPKLIGADATDQWLADETMLKLDGTPNKAKLGGNSTASVSAAVLKAGAASVGLPLYQHIGGVNACTLPAPGVHAYLGSIRYGGGKRSGGKPSVEFMAYDYKTFTEASYGCYEVHMAFSKILQEKYGITTIGLDRTVLPPGLFKHDREIWTLMTEAINKSGNEGKIGIQIDVAAGTYYNKGKDVYEGLFSKEDKTKDDLMKLYQDMVKKFPIVILEDPLDEDDYEGHAALTKKLNIQITGDDLFTTNVERLNIGLGVGAGNTVLLKVNQVGTISEAFETVRMAYAKGYGVQPCQSRGEGADIADYAVGLSCGTIRGSGFNFAANRFMAIEAELGSRAKFAGKAGFKTGPAKI